MPRETGLIPIDEDRAARIVNKALREALVRMEAVVQRMLARGDNPDARWLIEMTEALTDLASQYAGKTVKGTGWGQMIADAAKAGVDSLVLPKGTDISFKIDKKLIDTALWTREVKIKNLLQEGVSLLNEQISSALITGASPREISQIVKDTMVLKDGAAVPAWRAEMIARNEPFAAYRQSARAVAEAEGIELFQMRGPVDNRTSAICLQHVGMIRTAEEWEEVNELVFRYGLHPNCRHSWDPVYDAAGKTVQEIKGTLRGYAREKIEDRRAA